MTADERAAFDETYDATRLALEVGEKVRDAREAAGLTQRELATRMGTSQAAVARLEAGGIGATLTTLQKMAAALDLKITVEHDAVDVVRPARGEAAAGGDQHRPADAVQRHAVAGGQDLHAGQTGHDAAPERHASAGQDVVEDAQDAVVEGRVPPGQDRAHLPGPGPRARPRRCARNRPGGAPGAGPRR